MTSLDFLYIALGGGFLILVVFLSVLLLHLTLVLRDVSKITEDVREVTDKIKSTVLEPFHALAELTAKFGFINEVIERIKSKYAEHLNEEEPIEESPEKETKETEKNKNGFFTKKLKK